MLEFLAEQNPSALAIRSLMRELDKMSGNRRLHFKIPGPRWLLLCSVIAILLPAAVSFALWRFKPDEWHSNDLGALIGSTWLSFIFFILAWALGHEGQQRAEAVANAVLITSMGNLSMSSARSFAGNDQQALRMAADARAAMQHYPSASPAEQRLLLIKIQDSYSDLAFGTIARADALPRSTWEELRAGAQAVADEAGTLARKLRFHRSDQRDAMVETARHVTFVEALGNKIRASRAIQVTPRHPHDLNPWLHDAQSSQLSRLQQFMALYRRELAVVHDWRVLRAHVDKIECTVMLNDVDDAGSWLAPWYLTKSGAGGETLKPVNVLGRSLAWIHR